MLLFPLRAAVLVVVLASANRPVAAQNLAVTGATIIDGTGRAPIADGVVVIRNGKITAVGPSSAVTIPSDVTRVDARGKWVIPGMMDANLHLDLNINLEHLILFEDQYDKIVLEGAQIALKTGQTTVFDTWGPRAALIKVRDMINAGQAEGARIYLAGNIIGFSGPLGPDFIAPAAAWVTKSFAKQINETWEEGTGRALLWMPPDTLRAAIRKYTGLGVNFLKFGGSGHQEMDLLTFSPRQEHRRERGRGFGPRPHEASHRCPDEDGLRQPAPALHEDGVGEHPEPEPGRCVAHGVDRRGRRRSDPRRRFQDAGV